MTTTNRTRAAWRLTITMTAALTLAACDRGSRAEGNPVSDSSAGAAAIAPAELSLAARAALDSGNAAFKAQDYAKALGFYREAAKSTPNHAAPWYGINMAAKAMNNAALADSAMIEVRRLSNSTNPHVMPDSAFKEAHKGVKIPEPKA